MRSSSLSSERCQRSRRMWGMEGSRRGGRVGEEEEGGNLEVQRRDRVPAGRMLGWGVAALGSADAWSCLGSGLARADCGLCDHGPVPADGSGQAARCALSWADFGGCDRTARPRYVFGWFAGRGRFRNDARKKYRSGEGHSCRRRGDMWGSDLRVDHAQNRASLPMRRAARIVGVDVHQETWPASHD